MSISFDILICLPDYYSILINKSIYLPIILIIETLKQNGIMDNTITKTIKDETKEINPDNVLDSFAYLIHDIESPLASTKYLLKLLEENKYDFNNELHRKIVESSKISLERAESIIYDIMAVIKSGDSGFNAKMTNLVPDAIIKEAIVLVNGSAIENNIKVEFTNNSGDSIIKADPKLLKRILDNLLYNAVRHTPAGGTINVYTEPTTESVFIHIKDDGPGLEDVDPTILFEKFGQLEYRSNGKHRGVGLGLFFCKQAITEMEGTIFADDHPNGGAVFSIKLNKVS